MRLTHDEFRSILKEHEGENLEFKTAEHQFDSRKLMAYVVALANEGGGWLILGVSDVPRRVTGTAALRDTESVKHQVLDRLHMRVELDEIEEKGKRVVVVSVPSRPLGVPLHLDGKYLMRSGESLVAMTPDKLKRIFEEAGPDFSAEICEGTTPAELSDKAVRRYRSLWHRKSGNDTLLRLSDEQLLSDAELVVDGGVTYAAMVLLGDPDSLSQNLPPAEVIFEYRSSETSQSYQQRVEYRKGFFLYYEDIWEVINRRNEIQQYQDGLFRWDIPTFDEAVVREAILNAICHRDYRSGNSVMIRQFPDRLEIVSPGGFVDGVTPENILWRQAWRNRRIAEALAKCGLVERSGQGADRMFEQSIRYGKSVPDFSGSDDYQVSLTLHGKIQDVRFLRFLERVGRERVSSFSTEDFLVLDYLHREERVPARLKPRALALREEGIIETVGRGRGTRHILSRKLYEFLREPGAYTRKRGLDRDTNKALLLTHIERNRDAGSRLAELRQVLPDLSSDQVKKLVQELKAEGRIYLVGRKRGSRWHPSS